MAPPGFTSSKKAGPPAPSGKSATDIGRELDREITRREYFDSRKDVSDDRLDRRLKQAQELAKFKREETKPVYTTSGSIVKGLTQRRTPASMDLAEKQMQLANKYGPTLSEIGGDISYGIGQFGSALGERLASGSFGLLGVIKGIANYALDKANKGYDKLNDVQKYVFDNADRFTFASKVPQVDEVSKAEELALQADRDALGLELDQLIRERETEPTVDLRTAKDYIDYQVSRPSYATTQPVFPGEEVKQAAMNRFSPEYLEEQKRLLDELNIMPTVEELQPKEKSELGILDLLNPFDEVPIQMGINEMINPEQVDIEKFKEEMNQGSLSTDDGTKVTAYNNPVNLQFAGQQGAVEGQTYGNNFAVFPDAETGIMAAKRDLALKTERYGGNVDKIIGEFSPRSDNPESFDNYVNFVKSGVGETVDPGEEDELLRRVIRFENKPDIANQYLTMVADGGMIDKQLKSLQNGLQNMYNGIPSVKRR